MIVIPRFYFETLQTDWAAGFRPIKDIMSRVGMVRHRLMNVEIYQKGVNYLNITGTGEIEEQDIRDLK